MIFRQIKLYHNGKVVRLGQLFGISIYAFYRDMAKKIHFVNPKQLGITPPPPKEKSTQDSQVLFYLKVNNNQRATATFECLQHWIDIIDAMNARFIIICDKQLLSLRIYRHIIFHTTDVCIMKSITKPFKKIVKHLDSYWIPAANAHLSTLYHSKIHNIKHFWNIDADDTMICASPKRAAQMLQNVIDYAQNHHLSAFSLDMHSTRLKGKFWSFGVSFMSHNIDWFALLKAHIQEGKNQKLPFGSTLNLDFVVTYLKDSYNIKCESFYANNLVFLHFLKNNDFVRMPIIGSIYYYQNATLHTPILSIYNSPLAQIPIAENIIKIDDLDEFESLDECLMAYLLIDKSSEFRLRKLHGFHTDLTIFKEIEEEYQQALSQGNIIT
ncbi:hypothetical protein [Helicobacter typhlonius]|uniref:hypothetical protein n=3 Tax=Helicobacter typhlonius TaxID=76936 RepID=UPI002FE3B771